MDSFLVASKHPTMFHPYLDGIFMVTLMTRNHDQWYVLTHATLADQGQ